MSILYLVATPIGNLGDLSPRAREVLSSVDFLAAEDTRVSQKLLNACGLPKKPMISYYEHNRRARGEEVLARLRAGESCALVTDAGTPAVSDPGEDLVALCAAEGVPVVPVPGCCAAVCGLAVSGLPTGRWCFEGFLSVNKKARREHLDALAGEKRTMIFYEAPHKLCATLRDLAEAFGADRRVSLSRELTKLHEETLRMTLGEASAYFDEHPPRGEFVLTVAGAPEEPSTEQDEADRLAAAAEAVRRRIEAGQTQKDAVKAVSAETGVKKNALYRFVLEQDEENI
ncbi:MAG: 16S rRNA (cytidine(1402)-2'-O)-methyltransferase [Eubacteriales bacterium]|nr:16S rRNA (cytidine(1402)-2'-O)-methyltransferase [Eubacteriales bacterium]